MAQLLDRFPLVRVICRGLLFDMDGILISSIGSVERAWTKWADRHGMAPEAVLHAVHGRRAIESIQLLCPNLDPVPEHKWIEQMEIDDSGDIETLGGVRSLLQSLPDKHWTIVTSATRRLALVRLEAGNVPVPETIITADDVVNGKPDPEPYRKGADLLGFAPEDCIVIEDSASGVEAGKRAGCRVLATTFSHSLQSLSQADWVVESLEDIKVKVSPGGEGLELELSPIARD